MSRTWRVWYEEEGQVPRSLSRGYPRHNVHPHSAVIIYSFNESRISSVWDGFSLRWYRDLFRDKDLLDALANSLVLATVSSVSAAVIGTLAAVGMPRVKLKGKGAIEYISTLPIMIPEIILGMVFLVYFSLIRLPFGMTTLAVAHTSFCIPYVYMLVKARLVGIDKSFAKPRRTSAQASGMSSST